MSTTESTRHGADSESLPLLTNRTLSTELNAKQVPAIKEDPDANFWWIPMALAVGILFSLADLLISNHQSHQGLWALSFLGPINMLGVGAYRLIEAGILRYKHGYWIDKASSNYWTVDKKFDLAMFLDEDIEQEEEVEYKFNWWNLAMVIFTQAIPMLLFIVCLIYSFKYAILAGLNPGSITTLFALTSIYVSVCFYFCFNEKLSAMKVIGIILMLACVAVLAFDKKEPEKTNMVLT